MSKAIRVVYVAGPIRAVNAWLREQNIRVAERLALDLWDTHRAGVICPHAMGRFYDDGDYEKWLAGDFAILARCDGVLLTPNWQDSVGACAEKAEADRLGLPVWETITDFLLWDARVGIVDDVDWQDEVAESKVADPEEEMRRRGLLD